MDARDLVVEFGSEGDTLAIGGENIDAAALEIVGRTELDGGGPLLERSAGNSECFKDRNLQPRA